MSEISTGSLLSVNFFSVTPLANAASGGIRQSGAAATLNAATAATANANANAVSQLRSTQVSSPAVVAFNAEARLIDLTLNTGTLLDVFV